MKPDQKDDSFRNLHHQKGALILPNPWDIGTARILASMGFQALATTSAGMAFGLGVPEGNITREETLSHCKSIIGATPLPVSADLENGFGHTPRDVSSCIQEAAKVGLAGGSIEDFTGDKDNPIYDFGLAVERVTAAAEQKNNLDKDFVFTARCENFLWGRPDLDDTIKRLQAYEAAGADVLYAPGLPNLEAIQTVCSSVSLPVNVVVGIGPVFNIAELEAAGVKRISLGSALARYAFGAFVNAAQEMKQEQSFKFSADAINFAELGNYFIK
ncbi:MAG: isocitrate lyase/phosphoenolpyruvate mutase family protein [Gammaproteobacteria bacterium]|nr:isocitrate lyase/phosphoenolpyruvate mutase family protein [Gammaproteobacteria bacterium]